MPGAPPRSAAGSWAAARAFTASPTPISTKPLPPPGAATTSPWRGHRPAPPAAAGLRDALVGEALDLLHVLAFDADLPRRAVAPLRVQVAFVVEIGSARFQRVILDAPRFARLSLTGRSHLLVIRHHRLAARLAIDRL